MPSPRQIAEYYRRKIELLQNLRTTLPEVFREVFSMPEVQNYMLDLNKEQMLLYGVNADGERYPNYAWTTTQYTGKTGPYDLYMTGTFHNSMYVEVTGGGVEIKNGGPGYAIEHWNDAVGLTLENWEEVKSYVYPILKEKIRERLSEI